MYHVSYDDWWVSSEPVRECRVSLARRECIERPACPRPEREAILSAPMPRVGLVVCCRVGGTGAHSHDRSAYDIAFVQLHNDARDVNAAAAAIRERFGPELPSTGTSLDDLLANFADPSAQGPRAYVEQMLLEHPGLDGSTFPPRRSSPWCVCTSCS